MAWKYPQTKRPKRPRTPSKATVLYFRKMTNAQTDFIVTTEGGTRHAETGASMGEVRRKFWGKKIGLKIAKIERGRLFTHEEEREMDREKAIERSR